MNLFQDDFSEYQATAVQIILSDNIKQVFVPKLPDILQGKMHYQIQGAADTAHIIQLNPGVSLQLIDASRTKWIINATSLDDDVVSFGAGNIRIGSMSITGLTPASHITVIQKNSNMVRIDLQAQNLLPMEINETTSSINSSALIQQLKTLNQQHKLGAFVILDHHKVNDLDVGRAFYDSQRNRVLYIRAPNPGFNKNKIELITARQDDFYIQDISQNLEVVLK